MNVYIPTHTHTLDVRIFMYWSIGCVPKFLQMLESKNNADWRLPLWIETCRNPLRINHEKRQRNMSVDVGSVASVHLSGVRKTGVSMDFRW